MIIQAMKRIPLRYFEIVFCVLAGVAFLLIGANLAKGSIPKPVQLFWGAFGSKVGAIDLTPMQPIRRDFVGFYDWRFGLYARIYKGEEQHGGVPQRADMTAHLAKVRTDIEAAIPDPEWSGVGMIDYENWTPDWSRLDDPHKNLSRQIVREKYPDLTEPAVEQMARQEFETAAVNFWAQTLQTCKQTRPKGRWGFYGFPRDFEAADPARWQWLTDLSTVLLPSAYTVKAAKEAPANQWEAKPEWYVGQMQAIVGGARKMAPAKTIYAMIWYQYHNMNEVYKGQPLAEPDLSACLTVPLNCGADGLVIWDYFDNDQAVMNYNNYLRTTAGPMIGKTFTVQRVWQP